MLHLLHSVRGIVHLEKISRDPRKIFEEKFESFGWIFSEE